MLRYVAEMHALIRHEWCRPAAALQLRACARARSRALAPAHAHECTLLTHPSTHPPTHCTPTRSRSRREKAWELIQAQMDLMDEVSGESEDDADAK